MIDSYWVMVFDNVAEVAEGVMIICLALGIASMFISWLAYNNAREKKESFEWGIYKKGKVWALRFLIIGIIASLLFMFVPNKSYYYDRLLEEYRENKELQE